MAIEGKVRTLFTDKTQQEALFPKTKIKAISDDNGIGLDSILDDMVVAGAAVNDATVPVNADTLGGRPANDYITDEEVVYYSGDIAIDETVPLNADTLQGYKASDFATTDWVKGEIANAQLGGGSGEGEIDLSGFALKTDVTAEINNKISNIDYPVDSVNGKTGIVQLSAADVSAAPTGYGLGTVSTASNSTYVDDANNATLTGWYKIDSNTANGIGASAILRVEAYASTYTMQTAIRANGGVISTRYCNNGTWSEWKSMVDTIGAAPASLAMYTPKGVASNYCTNVRNVSLSDMGDPRNQVSVIAVEDASTLQGSPITTGPFYAYREVIMIKRPSDNSTKITVRLTENYPKAGRIWINNYNQDTNSWSGWGEISAPALDFGTYTSDVNNIGTLPVNRVAWITPTTVNNPYGNYGVMETWGASLTICNQRITYTNGCVCQRMRYNSAWTEWEWMNPPMMIGTEYRTAEQFNGKPLYVKAINFGDAPANTLKAIEHGIANIDQVIEAGGRMSHYPLPFEQDDGLKCYICFAHRTHIAMRATADWSTSQHNLTVWIKYTKL